VRRALAVAVAAAALAAPAAAHAASTVRTFAVGPRISPDWIDTRAHFHDKLLALVDARERGRPGVPPVQSGAGDVATHLAPGGAAANLVALPEDLGLLAAFTGSRGDAARSATGLVDAVVALIGSYAPVSSFYAAKYPQLTKRPLPTRLLAVSLTDTFGRVAVETFAELADRLNVTLVAGVNMARSWRIVCTSKATFHAPPGATGCDVEDPALVARLRSPDEPDRDYAYEATTPDAVNLALVFGPDGRIIGRQVKAYLTPIELPSQLDLKPGSIAGVRAIPTPAGRLGIATSKDAWMPDVLDRLEADGAQLLVQPEFFVGDTVGPGGMWAPDNLKAAGYADVLRHQGMAAVVLPSMTGNLFDFSADAQSHIAVQPAIAPGCRSSWEGSSIGVR
jgi:predicted amidohydrolase